MEKFYVAIFIEPQDQENSHIFAIGEKFSLNRTKLRFACTIKNSFKQRTLFLICAFFVAGMLNGKLTQ